MDYQALLYNPIYAIQGVPAVLTLADSEYEDLTILDKTAGVDIGEDVNIQTIRPVGVLRVAELTARGVSVDSLEGARIAFNGLSWEVTSYRVKPSPKGERDGEVYLILSDKTDDESESASASESESESESV